MRSAKDFFKIVAKDPDPALGIRKEEYKENKFSFLYSTFFPFL
jgi:hypothetical protein